MVKKLKTERNLWHDDFKLVDIKSSYDGSIQKAYFSKSDSSTPVPLVVSLHTWSGNYAQFDSIAVLCKSKNVNYIHPDFRGANTTVEACSSTAALSDIDDAISYAIANGPVDTTSIYVVGVSGGGHATLSTFMKSSHKISKFSAWAAITDLVAWYDQTRVRKVKYAEDIMDCTGSKNGSLNISIAKEKSPLFWTTPVDKLTEADLNIYAGIYDGILGNVPITHSIDFYNKVLADIGVDDSTKYVSKQEKLFLLEHRKPIGETVKIADRKIILKKESGNVKLVIFEGGHEMLTGYALEELLK